METDGVNKYLICLRNDFLSIQHIQMKGQKQKQYHLPKSLSNFVRFLCSAIANEWHKFFFVFFYK